MPELPDITLYLEALQYRVTGQVLKNVRVMSPFLLRTAMPPLQSACGRKVTGLRRLGKRLALGLEDDFWLVLHLMIAGRLHWLEARAQSSGAAGQPKAPKRKFAATQAAFEFDAGTLLLTEAGTKRRASLHLVRGEEALRGLDPGGLDVMACSLQEFTGALSSENHTLKRALTDPRLLSGIGNAYSDEILHRARLSPVALTQKLSPQQFARLHRAVQDTLHEWLQRLRSACGSAFPEGVTAFRPEMAVHGKFGRPCPTCGATVQRIRYADNETNYCPACQTEGRLLADRSLSRLLKQDWPRTPADLEEMKARVANPRRD